MMGKLGIAFVILVVTGASRAVDPIDFLESLKDDDDTFRAREQGSSTEYPNGVNVIPGEADVNYPTYASIPKSSFSCIGRPAGFYADTELRCQIWHICDETGVQQSFLCTNGTVYSQDKRVCDWWYNVNCDHDEVSRNYEQNYNLYKGAPSEGGKSEDESSPPKKYNQEKKNDADFEQAKPSKQYKNNDPFSQYPRKSVEQPKPRFNADNEERYSSPDEYSQPRRPASSPRPAPTTTYRPPTTYTTPAPPQALQGTSSFPGQSSTQSKATPRPNQGSSPSPQRSNPQIKTSTANGKRIVEIRVPISQIPPEIIAKYGKRIPENILKEIFLNFTRGQQKELQQEAISSAKPNNARSPIPLQPIPQQKPQSQSPPSHSSKKPVDYNLNGIPEKKPVTKQHSAPPPPSPAEPAHKFRHSTPRKVDGVKFATPTRELLAEFDDERQVVGESQNPIYSLQNLYNAQQFRGSARSKATQAPDYTKTTFEDYSRTTESFPSSTTPVPEFSRPQQRRRTGSPRPTTQRPFPPTTPAEPELITDRYVPVSTPEQKRMQEIKRILLVAQQGIKVLPPIPFLSSDAAPVEIPTARRAPPPPNQVRQKQYRTTTPIPDFSKIPPVPKIAIPDDYYVQNERFEESESRYPRPSLPPAFVEPSFQRSTQARPTTQFPTTTTTQRPTTTTRRPTSQVPFFEEPREFRRSKPVASKPAAKKVTPPPERNSDDYDNTPDEKFNTEELELLRLAQEYIDLTGQDFGVRQSPRNA